MSSELKCLIVDDFHPSIFDLIDAEGWQYDYLPEGDREIIKSRISEYDVFLTRSKTEVDEDLLAEAARLKVVGRAGSGIENIDRVYLENRGILLYNAPEGNCDAVGDHTVGLILGLTKNIFRASGEVKLEGAWNREKKQGSRIKCAMRRACGVWEYR